MGGKRSDGHRRHLDEERLPSLDVRENRDGSALGAVPSRRAASAAPYGHGCRRARGPLGVPPTPTLRTRGAGSICGAAHATFQDEDGHVLRRGGGRLGVLLRRRTASGAAVRGREGPSRPAGWFRDRAQPGVRCRAPPPFVRASTRPPAVPSLGPSFAGPPPRTAARRAQLLGQTSRQALRTTTTSAFGRTGPLSGQSERGPGFEPGANPFSIGFVRTCTKGTPRRRLSLSQTRPHTRIVRGSGGERVRG
eukprot:scaffold348_cov329-Pavlova_lutheri.AAC.35